MIYDAVSSAWPHWHIGEGKSGTLALFRNAASPIRPVRICVNTELSAFLSSLCIFSGILIVLSSSFLPLFSFIIVGRIP